MRRILGLAIVFALGVLAGGAGGFARWHKHPVDQRALLIQRKRELVLNRAKDMPAGGLVVFGDSIVERQQLVTLCGLPVFNAGVGSAKIAEVAPLVDQVLERTRPARVLVEIGPNDFLVDRKDETPLPAFMATFEHVLSKAGPHPIVAGMTLPSSAADPAAVAANQAMKAATIAAGGTYVEAVPAAMTEDGLHLAAPAGLQEWKRRAEAACR